MIALQSIGVLLCVVLLCFSAAAILPAIRADQADAHLIHCPGSGCVECEGEVSDMEALSAMQGLGMATSRNARKLVREVQSTTHCPDCEDPS